MDKIQPRGFLSTPSSGGGPAVLVLHAWWGLNETIKVFCKRLSSSGFVAFAPDLYDGRVAETIAGAEALVKSMDAGRARVEIDKAVAYLGAFPPAGEAGIAAIGFSLGAGFALDLAASNPEEVGKVVLFYGSGEGDFGSSKADYLGHFAENDEFEPKEYVDKLENYLKDLGRKVAFHHYKGTGHWFFEPDRLDAYNPEASNLAWERTLKFLRRN